MSSAPRSRSELGAALRAALLDPAAAVELRVHGRHQAAVLVALYPDAGELRVVLTRRRDDLRLHAGQISFPGGRREGDEELAVTALREAREEVGLDPAGVEIVGALPPTPTFVTNIAVYPFVGLVDPGQTWAPSEVEVAAILEPSLTELRDGWALREVETARGTLESDTYLLGDDLVWGATARMLTHLLEALPASSFGPAPPSGSPRDRRP